MLGSMRNSVGLMQIFRGIRTNAILREAKPGTNTSPSAGANVEHNFEKSYAPTKWNKMVLVWTNLFSDKKAIPKRVSGSTMQKAMSRTRIRIANSIIFMAFVGCLYVVITGKELREARKSEETKLEEKERAEMRGQIMAEYRASLNKNAANK